MIEITVVGDHFIVRMECGHQYRPLKKLKRDYVCHMCPIKKMPDEARIALRQKYDHRARMNP